MKFLLQLILVFISFISIALSKKCKTLDGYDCVFPFKYKDRTYSICTTIESNLSPWCATYTPYSRGWWGYCPPSCYTCGLSASISSSCNDDLARIASKTDFPWHVLIRRKEKYDLTSCSGIITSDQWVITTVSGLNTFKGQEKTTKIVQVGSSRMTEKYYFQTRKVEKTVEHEKFDPRTGVNDIALLKVTTKFKLNDLVLPLCMNLDQSMIHEGAYGTMSGISMTDRTVLQGDRIPISKTNYDVCNKPGVFCTPPNHGLKAMASGASLAMCLNGKCVLVGLHSTRSSSFSPDFNKFYSFTNIAYHLPWIFKNEK
ncbi:serine protease SSP1 [Lepeophtheirus salmonis]|uniref:serine protease SSP1 n=1 Tax=Lepeophtheirus salmonis TaxID=72036 RepID=UPI001AEB1EF7|nr:transmembrane protease serine 2-like [Lepeophtheirus salmonis]